MERNIIKIDEAGLKDDLKTLIRGTVEDTLNAMLDEEAASLCNAEKHERSEGRRNYRSGHYHRKLLTGAGELDIAVPKLRLAPFETAIIERYRRRESSVEESLIEMYLAGVSVRRVEDVTELLWGSRVSASTVSNLNQKVYGKIEEWRNRPLSGEYPYVFVDGIYLKRSWGGEMTSVSVLVAIGVNGDGYREILGAAEGASESKECWKSFLKSLKERGLKGVRLFTSDKHLGFLESVSEVFPDAKWQRCTVHFFRNVFTKVPRSKFAAVAALLKATYAQEDREATLAKVKDVERKLREMKLNSAADVYAKGVGETLTYLDFPGQHWRNIRTNNILERLNREIRRRTRVVGCFPDGESALMLVCARLRHVASKEWGTKRYLNMKHLYEQEKESELKRELEKHGKKGNVA